MRNRMRILIEPCSRPIATKCHREHDLIVVLKVHRKRCREIADTLGTYRFVIANLGDQSRYDNTQQKSH